MGLFNITVGVQKQFEKDTGDGSLEFLQAD